MVSIFKKSQSGTRERAVRRGFLHRALEHGQVGPEGWQSLTVRPRSLSAGLEKRRQLSRIGCAQVQGQTRMITREKISRIPGWGARAISRKESQGVSDLFDLVFAALKVFLCLRELSLPDRLRR